MEKNTTTTTTTKTTNTRVFLKSVFLFFSILSLRQWCS